MEKKFKNDEINNTSVQGLKNLVKKHILDESKESAAPKKLQDLQEARMSKK